MYEESPVPPCVVANGVDKPEIEVMSELAPEAAAPKLVRAPELVVAPVPPAKIGKVPAAKAEEDVE